MSEENAKWYVVHTYSGYENKVKATIEKAVENRGLSNLICEVKIPLENSVELKDSGKKEVEHKLFPGYVLIRMVMTDDSWYVVRNTRGVTGFVGPGSKPVALTDEEVAALGIGGAKLTLPYSVGDSVKIIGGPLDGYTGIVKELSPEENRVLVVVSMFGRETPCELELNQVQVVAE